MFCFSVNRLYKNIFFPWGSPPVFQTLSLSLSLKSPSIPWELHCGCHNQMFSQCPGSLIAAVSHLPTCLFNGWGFPFPFAPLGPFRTSPPALHSGPRLFPKDTSRVAASLTAIGSLLMDISPSGCQPALPLLRPQRPRLLPKSFFLKNLICKENHQCPVAQCY